MWYKKNYFKFTIEITLILLIIVLSIHILPVISTVIQFIFTISLPVLIAGLLYYVFRPIRHFLEKKMSRIAAVTTIFLLVIIILSIIVTFIAPTITAQIEEFSNTPKEKIKQIENIPVYMMDLFNIYQLSEEQLSKIFTYYTEKLFVLISDNIIFTLGSIAKIATFFVITPFILFYLLKDDLKIAKALIGIIPHDYRKPVRKILTDVDEALFTFISSQIIVAAIVGSLIFIGYSIIGLPKAFLLALFAFVFNLIPFFGPFISTIPALFIGLVISPLMGVKVVCVVLLVHFLDLNLISPRIVGTQLNIHPITILLLLVSSVPIVGLLGLFLVIPLYAVIKVVITDLYEMNEEKVEEIMEKME